MVTYCEVNHNSVTRMYGNILQTLCLSETDMQSHWTIHQVGMVLIQCSQDAGMYRSSRRSCLTVSMQKHAIRGGIGQVSFP